MRKHVLRQTMLLRSWPIAQHLLAAMKFAQDQYRGKNSELKEKIGNETQPDKILSLVGL